MIGREDDMDTPNLRKKLSSISAAVARINKTGTNTAQKYKFVKDEEVMARLNPVFAEHGVIIVPTQVVETRLEPYNDGFLCDLTVRFTIYDTDSDDTIVGESKGQGWDRGDKASNKAMTSAYKYFVLKTFALATGDDPEADSSTDTLNANASYPRAPQTTTPQRRASVSRVP